METGTWGRCLALPLGLTLTGACLAGTCKNDDGYFRFLDYGVDAAWHSAPAYLLAIDLKRGLVFSEDYGEEFVGCGKGEDALLEVCLKSFALDFSLPRKYVDAETWSFNGRTYRKVDTVELAVLGRFERVDRIMSEAEGKKYVYYYSRENGLRALVLPFDSRGMAQFFISSGVKGPFASCKDS